MNYDSSPPSGPKPRIPFSFQDDLPETIKLNFKVKDSSADYEEYEQEFMVAALLMKRYIDLITEHPEFAVPEEHNLYGGCAHIEMNFFVETGRVRMNENYPRIMVWVLDNHPSSSVSPYNWSNGGFPLVTIEDVYEDGSVN
jgi:hypothetical protein